MKHSRSSCPWEARIIRGGATLACRRFVASTRLGFLRIAILLSTILTPTGWRSVSSSSSTTTIQSWTAGERRPSHRRMARSWRSMFDNFVNYDRIKWSETLKKRLVEGHEAVFDSSQVGRSLYRPFTPVSLYSGAPLIDRPGHCRRFFPTGKSHDENVLICVNLTVDALLHVSRQISSRISSRRPASVRPRIASRCTRTAKWTGTAKTTFPCSRCSTFSRIIATSRSRERISSITCMACFTIRPTAPIMPRTSNASWRGSRCAAKPRTFAFSAAGRELVDIHVNYEKVSPYTLKRTENPVLPLDWRVEAMKLTRSTTQFTTTTF